MIPVRQTKFVDTDGMGNCQSACMASILELPLSEVLDTATKEVRDRGFWRSVNEWLAERNLRIESYYPNHMKELPKGIYSIGCGPSPRGDYWHAVVCKNGIMVWDPHPSDDGVLSIERYDVIVKKGEDDEIS